MKKDQYLKHDASALGNRKLMNLCREEGLRGYGAYWVLIESLRNQPGMRDSMELLSVLAYRMRTKPAFLRHIVEDYGLFVVEQGMFYSPGLCKRMRPFMSRQQVDEKLDQEGQDSRNQLIDKDDWGDSAGTAEQSREEKTLSQEGEGNEVQGIDARRMQVQSRGQGLREVLPFDATIAGLHQQQAWREEMAMKSGQSRVFMQHFAWLVEEFVSFLRLRGEEGTIWDVSDAKRRFYYWMVGKEGRKCMEALKIRERGGAGDLYCYETLVDGQRTYLGRPIPEDAPPRPDQYAIWDEATQTWHR